ncbi:MAG: 2-hydroxyacyl-CoA dehydratase family protein [bacterium]
MTMMETYFHDLVGGLRKKLEEKETARRRFILEVGRIGEKMFDPGWSSAWTTVFVPFEILNSMGVAAIFVEFVGAMLSGAGIAKPYFEKAESAGYSTDGCAYHRTSIGAAMAGVIPEPDLLIGATCPCDGGAKAVRRIGDLFGKETFILTVPYEVTEESIGYMVDQFKRMIDFITEKTGRELDIDKLREAIRHGNEGRRYMMEALELCKNVPSPCNSNDLKNFIIYVLISGLKEGVEVAKLFRDEFRERVEKGVPGLPGEKHRLLWIQNRIQFRNGLIEMLERDFKANVVIDELNYFHWEEMDDGDPLRALAIRQITHPFAGPAGRRLAMLAKLAKEFKVHGAINPSHWGCRQSGGARNLFRDALAEVGVPIIHLDVDCVDERNYSDGQLRTRLEAFMEML